MPPLCAVHAHGSAAPPWAPNASALASRYPPPLHFFDWALARGCRWAVFVLPETYVDFEVLQRRLDCLSSVRPRVLGRLSDRYDTRYPIMRGRPLPVPKLAAGLVVSGAALRGHSRHVSQACSEAEFNMLMEYTALHPSMQGHLGFLKDFAAALCLRHAKVPVAEPLGHEEEHFVLGPGAAERLMVRRATAAAAFFRRRRARALRALGAPGVAGGAARARRFQPRPLQRRPRRAHLHGKR